MSLKDWRARRSMRDPVRGEFRVTDSYTAHPGATPPRDMLTGVVTGPGVPATAGEHLADTSGKWTTHQVLPVMVDRAEPARFVVLWDEVPKPDWRADARAKAAQAAERMRSGPPAPAAPGPSAGGWVQPGGWVQQDGSQVPDWAQGLLAGLTGPGSGPVVVDGGTQVIDVTAGHLSAADAAQLTATGEPATAVITAVSEVALPQAALPGPTASLCDLALRVTRGSGASYEASTRQGFRSAERRAAVTAPGLVLPVRVDPYDPSRVAIDVPAFDRQQPGF